MIFSVGVTAFTMNEVSPTVYLQNPVGMISYSKGQKPLEKRIEDDQFHRNGML